MALQKSLPHSQSPHHLPQLEGVRGLAALYVVVTHALTNYDFSNQHLPGAMRLLAFIFGHGHSMVSLFIVLSGFCLMIPVTASGTLRGGALAFFKRRAVRILPTYYAALLLSILLGTTLIKHGSGSSYDAFLPITVKDVVTHVLLVHELFYDTALKINGPFWSIGVEWKIYFLMPLLVALVYRRGWWQTLLVSFVIAYTLVALFLLVPALRVIDTQDFGLMPQYLFLFVLGMFSASVTFEANPAFAAVRKHLENPTLLVWVTVAMLLFINSSQPLHLLHLPELPEYIKDIPVGIWAALLLGFTVRQQSGSLHRLLTWKPLVLLGTFGFSLYLMHQPALQLFWQYVLVPFLPASPLVRCLLLSTVGTLFAVGFCYLFYLACEKPVTFWRKSHKASETTAKSLNTASTA